MASPLRGRFPGWGFTARQRWDDQYASGTPPGAGPWALTALRGHWPTGEAGQGATPSQKSARPRPVRSRSCSSLAPRRSTGGLHRPALGAGSGGPWHRDWRPPGRSADGPGFRSAAPAGEGGNAGDQLPGLAAGVRILKTNIDANTRSQARCRSVTVTRSGAESASPAKDQAPWPAPGRRPGCRTHRTTTSTAGGPPGGWRRCAGRRPRPAPHGRVAVLDVVEGGRVKMATSTLSATSPHPRPGPGWPPGSRPTGRRRPGSPSSAPRSATGCPGGPARPAPTRPGPPGDQLAGRADRRPRGGQGKAQAEHGGLLVELGFVAELPGGDQAVGELLGRGRPEVDRLLGEGGDPGVKGPAARRGGGPEPRAGGDGAGPPRSARVLPPRPPAVRRR